MRQRFIHTYVGVGDHGYRHERVKGPYDGMIKALLDLEERHGSDMVNDNITKLVCGDLDGTIAWFNDDLGYCITDSEVE